MIKSKRMDGIVELKDINVAIVIKLDATHTRLGYHLLVKYIIKRFRQKKEFYNFLNLIKLLFRQAHTYFDVFCRFCLDTQLVLQMNAN